MALQGNGQDLLALKHAFRYFRLHIAEERMQRREAMVLRADRGLPVFAQMIEKCLDKGGIDLCER